MKTGNESHLCPLSLAVYVQWKMSRDEYPDRKYTQFILIFLSFESKIREFERLVGPLDEMVKYRAVML